jgi:hypothetical protein
MENKMFEFRAYEPLRANRWIIETSPTEITPYLFRKYRMFNEGDKIVFKTEFLETVDISYNPLDLMEITDITLKYLDPVGEVVGGFKMIVGGLNFDKKHSYSDDEFLITKMRFVIEQIQPLYKKSEEIYSSHGQPKE